MSMPAKDAAASAAIPVAALQFALLERIEADVEHAGDQLELGVRLAVLARARVGGDRLGALVRRVAVGVDLEAQRGREAFLGFAAGQIAGVRFAADDQAEDALGSVRAA